MGRLQNYKKILLQNVEEDKKEKEKLNEVRKIRISVMNILSKCDSLKDFEIKSKSALNKLEKIDIVQRHKLDVKIINWLKRYKPVFLKEFKTYPDPIPKRKKNYTDLFFYSEMKNPTLEISIKDRYKYFVEGEQLFNYLEFTFMKKDFIEYIKILVTEKPDIFDLINKISFPIILGNEKKINELENEIKDLKDDRIYLFELSKYIDERVKYKIIIEGISKGNFELQKLSEVKEYLFTEIADNNIKRSIVKQIVEHLYKELCDLKGIKYNKTYIQKIIYGIKKGYKKISTNSVKKK